MIEISYFHSNNPIRSYVWILFISFLVLCILCVGIADGLRDTSSSSKSSSNKVSSSHASSGHDSSTSSKYFSSGSLPAGYEWINQLQNPTSCVSGMKVKTGQNSLKNGYSASFSKYTSDELARFQQGVTQPGWAGQGTTVYFDSRYGWLKGSDTQTSTPDTGQIFAPPTGLWAVEGQNRPFEDDNQQGQTGSQQSDQGNPLEFGPYFWRFDSPTDNGGDSGTGAQTSTPDTGQIFAPPTGLWAVEGQNRPFEDDNQQGQQTGSQQNSRMGIYNPATGQWLTQPGWAGQGTTVYYDPSYGWVSGTGAQTGTEDTTKTVTDDSVGIFRQSSGLWAIEGHNPSGQGAYYYDSNTGDYVFSGDNNAQTGTQTGTDDSSQAEVSESGQIFAPPTGLWAVRGLTRDYFGDSDSQTGTQTGTDDSGQTEVSESGQIFAPPTGLWAVREVKRFDFNPGASDSQTGTQTGTDDSSQTEVSESGQLFRPSAGLWAVRGVTRDYFGDSDSQTGTQTGTDDSSQAGTGTDDISYGQGDSNWDPYSTTWSPVQSPNGNWYLVTPGGYDPTGAVDSWYMVQVQNVPDTQKEPVKESINQLYASERQTLRNFIYDLNRDVYHTFGIKVTDADLDVAIQEFIDKHGLETARHYAYTYNVQESVQELLNYYGPERVRKELFGGTIFGEEKLR